MLLPLILTLALAAADDGAADSSESWSAITVSTSVSGRLSGDSSNTRPVTMGLGVARWADAWSFQAQIHHAPRFGPTLVSNEEGSLLMRPGGRYGLTASVRLHELTTLGGLPLTVGGYLTGDASMDNAPDGTGGERSWTSIRGDLGGGLYWWFSRKPSRTAYASLEAGPVIRRRAGDEAGTWVGVGSTLSLTLNRVSLFASATYLASGSQRVAGLTGSHVYAGISLTSGVLEL